MKTGVTTVSVNTQPEETAVKLSNDKCQTEFMQ